MSAVSLFLTCPNSIDSILPNLYLTSRDHVNNTKHLKELNISHILTIEDDPIDSTIQNQFEYKYKKLSDNMFNDLIDILEECIEFIDSAVQNSNNIVVHCLAGISRSASVVIAYVMAKKKLTFKEAYELVKQSRSVRPNPGFIHQLQLFELMNFRVDKDSVIYKTFKLDNLTYLAKIGLGRDIDIKTYYFPSEVTDIDTNIVLYNCKQCGCKLFNNKNIIPHLKGQDFRGFYKRSERLEIYKELARNSDETKCDKVLNIEPLCWFMDKLEPNCGEIKCPQCNVKVGTFSWLGNPCDCHAWIKPAFYIDDSCVEII